MSTHSTGCINCGNTFEYKSKHYGRKNIHSKIQSIDKTIKDVLEEEYNVILSPKQRCTRFLCTTCTCTVTSIAKSSKSKKEFRDTAGPSSYLKRKIHSVGVVSNKITTPVSTPRKRRRLFSPIKVLPSSRPPQVPAHAPIRRCTNRHVKESNTTVARALCYINRRQYKRGIRLLMKSRVGFKNAMAECLQDIVRGEVCDFVKKDNTFNGGKTLEEMTAFNWNTLYDELRNNCPALTNMLVGSVTSKMSEKYLGLVSRKTTSAIPTIGAVASISMYTRKRTLNNFQDMNSLQMWLSSAKRELFASFNHVGLCTGITATRSSVDRIRKKYDNEVYEMKAAASDYLSGLTMSHDTEDTIAYGASEEDATDIDIDSDVLMESPRDSPVAVQPAHPILHAETDDSESSRSSTSQHTGCAGYSICFDNVNTKVTVRHQCRDKTNKMFNMVKAYAAKDRVTSLHLSDVSPSPREMLEIPLRVYFPSNLDEVTLRSEMTTIVTRTIAKNIAAFHDIESDVNQHLLHRYSKESSKKSSMFRYLLGWMDKDEAKIADTIDIMDEYHKYVPLKPNGHPLTIPLLADALSCERGNDAQNARINSHSLWWQLQGLTLNAQVWHKRCTLLQDVYDELYGTSAREKGTLAHLKNFFNHRNVTTNVKQSFNHSDEFLTFCGDGYVTLAACHFLGISEIGQIPEDFPTDKTEMMTLIDSIASKILDMVFLSCQHIVRNILEEGDGVDDDEDEDDDNYPYCVCRKEIPSEPMIFCENRNCPRGKWFHLDCVNMSEDDIPDEKWYCCETCVKGAGKRVKRT